MPLSIEDKGKILSFSLEFLQLYSDVRLTPWKHCAILMGDARKHAHFIPITPRVLQAFLEVGFVLRENIIKLQWKMKGTRENWNGTKYNFLLIGHENLYVFRKLKEDESKAKFKNSMKWW